MDTPYSPNFPVSTRTRLSLESTIKYGALVLKMNGSREKNQMAHRDLRAKDWVLKFFKYIWMAASSYPCFSLSQTQL